MTTRLAPHLVKPVPFLYPLTHRVWERPVRGRRPGAVRHDRRPQQPAGPEAPVAPGGAAGLPGAARRRVRRRGALLRRPGRRRAAHADRGPHGGPLRRGRPLVHPGRRLRARVRPRRRRRGRATPRTAESRPCRAGVVLNCTGVWTDEIQAMSGGRGRFRVRASKGVHIVVPREKITGDAGLILRTATSVLFVIPWRNHWLIGTTDTDWNLDLAHPAATRNRHRLPAAAGERSAGRAASGTRTSRASTPACGRCSPASRRRRRRCRASTRSPASCPGWCRSPAASTRPTA